MTDKPTTYQLPDGTRTNLLPGCTDCQGRADVLGINLKPTGTEAIQAVADEMSGIQIGSGYYSTTINGSEARECAEAALSFIRDAIHRDGDDANAIRQALGLTQKWGVRYERDGAPRMDNPSGVDTAELQVLDKDTARQAVKNWAPISARNHRIVRRIVGDWQEVQP